MYQDVTSLKPLFLSEEETLALLDLCLMSSSELDETKEQAIRKLTELARQHMREGEPTVTADREPGRGVARDIALSLSIGDILCSDSGMGAPEPLTPTTMMARSMARSHAPRRQMGSALADSRRRLRRIA